MPRRRIPLLPKKITKQLLRKISKVTPISPRSANLSQNYAGNQSINLQPSINGTTFNYLECFNYPVSLNNVQLHELKNKYILYLLDINNLVIYVSSGKKIQLFKIKQNQRQYPKLYNR